MPLRNSPPAYLRALVLACAIGSGSAWAAPGDHIRAGEVEISPDLGFGAEYRTNVYRSEENQIPAANLLIRPAALLSAAGDDHEFKLSGAWELRKYLFVGDEGPPDAVGSLDRYDEFQISGGADTFKRNLIGFRGTEDMALHNFRADAAAAKIPYVSQYRNNLALGLRMNPGPALEVVPALTWAYDSFRIPADDGVDRGLNTRNTFGPKLDAKWAFLPRTSVVFDAEWTYQDWQNNLLDGLASQGYDTLVLPNANTVKVMAGLDGRFTEKVLAQVMLGYGVGMFNEASVGAVVPGAGADATGLDGLLVKAQLKYVITPSQQDRQGTSVTGGYDKEFRASFFTNYVELNEVFAELHVRAGQVEPVLRYAFRTEDYRGDIARNDLVNRLDADVNLAASDWMKFTAGGWWMDRLSSDPDVNYDDVNFHLLATFAY